MQKSRLTLVLVSMTVTLTSGAEQLKSLSSLTVFDGDDKKVGPVFILAGGGEVPGVLIAFAVDEQPFLLVVSALRLSGSGDQGVFFQSDNCSGTPLIQRGAISVGSLTSPAVISAPGSTVYLAEPDATFQTFDPFVGTRLNSNQTCQLIGGTLMLVPARPVVDLDTLFTPPFSVR